MKYIWQCWEFYSSFQEQINWLHPKTQEEWENGSRSIKWMKAQSMNWAEMTIRIFSLEQNALTYLAYCALCKLFLNKKGEQKQERQSKNKEAVENIYPSYDLFIWPHTFLYGSDQDITFIVLDSIKCYVCFCDYAYLPLIRIKNWYKFLSMV